MKPVIISGTSNRALAIKIAQRLNCSLGQVEIKKFSDGETYVNIKENLKNKSVFIIQSGSNPANEYIFETMLLIAAAKDLKPKKIVIVFPFYPYRRQERKIFPGEALSAKVVANLITFAGTDEIITCNLHSTTIETFFTIPQYHIRLWDIFIDYFKKVISKNKNFCVVAPDAGSMRRSKTVAQALNVPLVLVEKCRPKHDIVEINNIVGEVEGKNIIIIDDEINTAGTVISVAKALKNLGANKILLGAIHPVLSGDAIKKLNKSCFEKIVVLDTIKLSNEKRIKKIKILSAAPAIANTILERI